MTALQASVKFLLGHVERFGDGDHSPKAAQLRESLEREIATVAKVKTEPAQKVETPGGNSNEEKK